MSTVPIAVHGLPSGTRAPLRQFVYFAHIGPYVKVGRSAHPARRIAQIVGIEWGNRPWHPPFHPDTSGRRFDPCDADLHGVTAVQVVDGHDSEHDAHKALADFRAEGEWFVAEPALLEWVARRKSGDDFSDALPREGGAYEEPDNPGRRAQMDEMREALQKVSDVLFGGAA